MMWMLPVSVPAHCSLVLFSAVLFGVTIAFQPQRRLAFSIRQQPLVGRYRYQKHVCSDFSFRLLSETQPEFSATDGQDDFYNDYDSYGSENSATFRQHRNDYGDLVIINQDATAATKTASMTNNQSFLPQTASKRPPTEHGCLRPGTVVQIEVGDLSLARKAWKKRRRSGSPLLVPCSILNVDRLSMVRWNLLFLLEKFGRPVEASASSSAFKRYAADAIEISLASLARNYRSFLKSSLQRQVDALGFASSQEMMTSLFNEKVQKAYGVVLDERTDELRDQSMLYLTAPISRRKAQGRTVNAPMMQFRLPRDGDHGDIDTLTHTGYVRSLVQASNDDNTETRDYSYLPLSAALRVSRKEDLESGRIVEGSILSAAVFSYDVIGDGGSPLLTLTVDPRTVRDKLKYKDRNRVLLPKPAVLLGELKMGDGPFTAKVVEMKKGQAMVDFGVGRQIPGMQGSEKVLATLRYKDALEFVDDSPSSQKVRMNSFIEDDDEDDDVEQLIAATIDDLDILDEEEDDWDVEIDDTIGIDDEEVDDGESEMLAESVDALLALRQDVYVEEDEVEEDISHLFEVDSNGNLMYKDPETGELSALEEEDEFFEMSGEKDDENFGNDIMEDEDNDDDGCSENSDESGDVDEDISDDEMSRLFVQNEDGSISFCDPETGETLDVKEGDEEYQDMLTMKSLIDEYLPKKQIAETKLEKNNPGLPRTTNTSQKRPRLQRKIIDVGDYVKVFVLDTSKELRVTTNPLVKGLKPKEIKKEEESHKKLSRLRIQIGGNLANVLSLKGRKVNGLVKAASKTGNWVYVQPIWSKDLPVGIGRLISEELQDISAGDYVECLFDGIDYDRGQLALQVVQKLDDDAVSRIKFEKPTKKPLDINVRSVARNRKRKSKSGSKEDTVGRSSAARGSS
ncbi:hypothetical protein IV203_035732 [Nitzschia inconspicua]|uniref:Uncharacterized protein n=1 Tax=Nitzschia inconspicua TaxID=303405 RepID=A0A9K3LFK9_9STRA|nr:hypothetical protein IV203_035732 [Nitzschia inconspicua]